ncbi:SerT [Bugula neritina]|uniref:SerT n=1 Tax=Bugula neritina TaxID=10212 RepID=A0A7J7IZ59_BUGNE|nr:SerT [Bugula neritina]
MYLLGGLPLFYLELALGQYQRAVWVTAIFPYIVLIILLVRGVTLQGASRGISFYLTPKWDKLTDYNVWNAAAAQVFFSLGPGFGVLLALSSYNKFHNNCYRDALITSSINCLTSLLAGFVVFSGIGYMADKLNKDVESVAQEGPGLVFEVYPEVIAQLPGSSFFAIIFFLMLITLGLDSTFGGLEALITGVLDEFKILKKRREVFVAVLLCTCFLASLPTTTYGGKYLVQLIDRFAAPVSILFIVFLEAVAILFCLSIWMETRDSVITIGEDVYPRWATTVGWLIICSSLICIPACAVFQLYKAKGTFLQRIRTCMTPQENPVIPDDVTSIEPRITHPTSADPSECDV